MIPEVVAVSPFPIEGEQGMVDTLPKCKASKFGAWPNYGRAKTGYITFQGDHDGMLALRNIKIRELK